MKKDPDKLSFLEHLEELRWRLVRAGAAILVFGVLAFIFKNIVFDKILLGPKNNDFITYRAFCKLSDWLGLGDAFCLTTSFQLQSISMSGQFTSHVVVSLIAGFIAAFPYVFYEIWAFIMPGLKNQEKAISNSVIFAITFLFIAGILFGYYLIAPLSVQFLGGYQVSEEVINQITLDSYVTTVASTTLSAGLVFQLPVAVYFLSKLGLVTPGALRKFRRHAIVGVLIVAAVITPPDITSQILVSLPLLVLYEISIIISRIVTQRQQLP